jgi:hypothetical protein
MLDAGAVKRAENRRTGSDGGLPALRGHVAERCGWAKKGTLIGKRAEVRSQKSEVRGPVLE